MQTPNTQHPRVDTRGKVTRRGLLTTAAALAAAGPASLPAIDNDGRPNGSILAYVGAYTCAVGNGGNGQGIYLFSLDLSSGTLTQIKVASTVPSPSWLAIHLKGGICTP